MLRPRRSCATSIPSFMVPGVGTTDVRVCNSKHPYPMLGPVFPSHEGLAGKARIAVSRIGRHFIAHPVR